MPDLSSFFAIPADASFWDVANSPVLVTFLAAIIGWQLNKRVTKAEEKAEDAQSFVTLKEGLEEREAELDGEIADVSESGAAGQSGDDHRTEARKVFDEAVAFVEQRIRDDNDGRHQRTYKSLGRVRPALKAAALFEREQLKQSQYDAAVQLFREWTQYHQGRAANKRVPLEVLERMQQSLRALRSA